MKSHESSSFFGENLAEFENALGLLSSIPENTLNKILEVLKQEGDSISVARLAHDMNNYAGNIDQIVTITLYVNHMMLVHNTTIDTAKKALIDQGIKESTVTKLLDTLSECDASTKNKLELLFWTVVQVGQNLHISEITGDIAYTRIEGEKPKELGLAPTVTLRLEIESADGTKQTFNIFNTLGSLSVMIRTLVEIYAKALVDAQKMKMELKDRIICLPKED